MQRQTEDGAAYERRLDSLSQEIISMRQHISHLQEQQLQYQRETETYRDKCYTLEGDMAAKMEQYDQLSGQHSQLQGLYEDLYVRKGGLGEGVVKVENEQLREDNAKLMKMIQQTKEFQEFRGFVEDSGGNVKGVTIPKVSAE